MLVPRKGTKFLWIGKRAAKLIDQLGHNRVTLRCDNEPAIEALAREIAQARQEGSQAVPGRPPVGESQSNGIVERAVGLVVGQARTLKAALEHRVGTRSPPDARKQGWLVEFAAYLMNRCDLGGDGKTPLHREDSVHASQASKRRKVGTAIPSWSVCCHAELVVRGSGCHRARTARRTSGEFLSRKGGTRVEYSKCEPFRGPQVAVTSIRYSIWNGEVRGDGASPPGRPANGEQGGEDVPSHSRLRTVGSQRRLGAGT